MTIKAGCRFSKLYVNGTTMMMAAGGAVSDNLESRLMKDARSVDGKCLKICVNIKAYTGGKHKRGAQE